MEKRNSKNRRRLAYATAFVATGIFFPELSLASEAALDAATDPIGELTDTIYDLLTGNVATLLGVGLTGVAAINIASGGLNRQTLLSPTGGVLAIAGMGPIVLNLLGSATI